MSNNSRQVQFANGIQLLQQRLHSLSQAAVFDEIRELGPKIAQMEFISSELAALSHGASLLSDRLAEWAGDLLENPRS